MMTLKINKADPSDKVRIQRDIRFSRRFYMDFNGFSFDEQLAGSHGMDFRLFVPPGTQMQDIENAYQAAKNTRDVASFTVTECPQSWFEEVEAMLAQENHARFQSREQDSANNGLKLN